MVKAGVVVGRGRNRTNETKNATRHAEFEVYDDLLAAAGGNVASAAEIAKDSTVCVSLSLSLPPSLSLSLLLSASLISLSCRLCVPCPPRPNVRAWDCILTFVRCAVYSFAVLFVCACACACACAYDYAYVWCIRVAVPLLTCPTPTPLQICDGGALHHVRVDAASTPHKGRLLRLYVTFLTQYLRFVSHVSPLLKGRIILNKSTTK